MQLSVDLRCVFVPLIGLTLRFLISQLYSSWPQNGNFQLESLGLPMFLLTLLTIVVVILLRLEISVKLDLKVEGHMSRTADVSVSLTILLLASLIFPLSLFWFAYLMLLILSPCSEHIFNQLKNFVYWLCHTFRATFLCIIGRQEESETTLPDQVQIQLSTEVEGSNNA